MSIVWVWTGCQVPVRQITELTPPRVPSPGQACQPVATLLNSWICGVWNSWRPATVIPALSRSCTAHGGRVAYCGRSLPGPVWEAPSMLNDATRNAAAGRSGLEDAVGDGLAEADALVACAEWWARFAVLSARAAIVEGDGVGGAEVSVCPELSGCAAGAACAAAAGVVRARCAGACCCRGVDVSWSAGAPAAWRAASTPGTDSPNAEPATGSATTAIGTTAIRAQSRPRDRCGLGRGRPRWACGRGGSLSVTPGDGTGARQPRHHRGPQVGDADETGGARGADGAGEVQHQLAPGAG